MDKSDNDAKVGNSSVTKSNCNFSALIKLNENQKFIESIKDLNAKANNYGLAITENAAREISVRRRNALTENERVEIKSDAITRLTSAFLDSRYITQNELSETIGEIIDIFYYLKNETENSVSDDDLISEMLDVFTNTCCGSVELMQSKGAEKILRRVKFGDTEIWDDKIKWGEDESFSRDLRDLNREELLEYEDGWRE